MFETALLLEELKAIAAEHRGDVALFARNLSTGETAGIRAGEAVQTASVIKLAILYEAIQQVGSGKARLEDAIVMHKDDQVPRSGVLLFFDTPMRLTLKDALTMMIAMSDNTATNLVIDHIGLASVNQRMQKLGLSNTCLYRKVFRPAENAVPEDQQRFGLGRSTAREMAELMQKIAMCELGEEGMSPGPADRQFGELMIHMLQNQFYRGGIPRYLRSMYTDTESKIANKTGELNAVRNDVAVIDSKEGMLIVAICTFNNQDQSWSVDNEGEITIAKLARAIVAAWSPEDL